jgi:hypothetical protein
VGSESTAVKARLSHFQARRRHFFDEISEVEAVNAISDKCTGDSPHHGHPFHTSSVSDLTFDSVDGSRSIRSGAPLDGIEEASSVQDSASAGDGLAESERCSPVEIHSFLGLIADWIDGSRSRLDISADVPPFHEAVNMTSQSPFDEFPDVCESINAANSQAMWPSTCAAAAVVTPPHPNRLNDSGVAVDSQREYICTDTDMETSDELDISGSTDQSQWPSIAIGLLDETVKFKIGETAVEKQWRLDDLLFPDDSDTWIEQEGLVGAAPSPQSCDKLYLKQSVGETTIADCSSSVGRHFGASTLKDTILRQLERAVSQKRLTHSE